MIDFAQGDLSQGWMPVVIDLGLKPGLATHIPVRWVEFGTPPLAEPFFDQTVANLLNGPSRAREIITDHSALLRAAGIRPESTGPVSRPAGFIFHISRCGSTLLANSMKTADAAIVVSESRAATGLLRPYSPSIGPYLNARWNRTRDTLLDALFALLSRYRTGRPEPLIVKFTSINILCLSVIRALWPDVPCVIVVRDPAEVMVASLGGGGWMTLQQSPEIACETFGWTGMENSLAGLTAEEFSARVLGRFFAAALEALDNRCWVVDYEDLNPKRVREIAEFFGLSLPPEPDRLQNVFDTYAKDPKRALKFTDDRIHKQQAATKLVRATARQWAMPAYVELRARHTP